MSFQFDDFVVDPVGFRLTKSGQPVAIEPKALGVLIALVERRERPVTKQELLDEVWSDVTVTENALTRAIAQLRKTLGDNAEAPRYIETVPTRGYRFIGRLATDTPTSVPAAPPPPRRPIAPLIALLVIVATAAAVIVLHRQLRFGVLSGSVATPIAARPFRSTERFEVSPSFSPDGASIVYSAEVNGTSHLFIATLAGSSERQLTNGDGEAQPSWSPDGESIAYASVRRGGIWLTNVNGGAPVQLTTFGSRPSWSPDGAEIAFESAEDIEYGWNAYDALPPSTIWIVDIASRRTRPLTTAGNPAGGHGAPSWRRDGDRLAFSSCDHERCGIYTIARDSSALTRIATDSRRLASPVFSVDGRSVYFVLSLYNQSLLLAVDVDADGNARGASKVLRESNPGVIQHLALSLDGSRFAWSIVEEQSNLFVVDASSSSPVQLTNNARSDATFPSFSPSSQKIAYCAVAAGNESGIWLVDANGSNAEALTIGPGLKQYVRWGRDWNIFYSAWSAAEHRAVVYRVSLNDPDCHIVARLPEGASAPAMSPDLRTVAFNRTLDGVTSVWFAAPDGSQLRRVSEDDQLARFPVWSPSGKSVAVQLRRDGSSIAILPQQKVLVRGGENWPYSWSPDEKEIAFAGRREGVWNVWTVNVATGRTRKLTNFTSTLSWVRTPSFSPDGKRIVFELGSSRGDLWLSERRR